jgi:hypothetical protein
VAHSSDGRADIIHPSLLESTIVMSVLTSAHPSLLDIKHNMYSACKRKHNLHTTSVDVCVCTIKRSCKDLNTYAPIIKERGRCSTLFIRSL